MGMPEKYVFGDYRIKDTPYEQWIRRHVRGSRFVLDYGCGLGLRSKWLVEYEPQARVELFDIDGEAQREAEARLLGFTAHFDNYDLILVFAVLELLDDEEAQVKLLSELKGRLLDQGKLVIMNVAYNPMAERWLYLRVLGKGNAISFHEAHRFHRSYVSSGRFHQIVGQAGLRIVDQLNGPILSFLGTTVNHKISKVKSLHRLSWYHYYVLMA